jgi:LmbE family N-acetylglucosaminyl deacetylase
MKEMDPREIERVVAEQIQRLQPNIIVSYPVHGISGFEDHLVMHAVAKRVFLELRDQGHAYLKRLAFYTLGPANTDIEASIFPLKRSKMEEIDCVVEVSDQDAEQMRNGLRCYVSYAEVIAKSKVMEVAGGTHYFEFYQEQFQPPVADVTEGL